MAVNATYMLPMSGVWTCILIFYVISKDETAFHRRCNEGCIISIACTLGFCGSFVRGIVLGIREPRSFISCFVSHVPFDYFTAP